MWLWAQTSKQSPIPGSDYLEFAQIFEFFVFDIRLLGNTGQLGKGSQYCGSVIHYGPLQCPVDTVHCPYLYFGLVQMQTIIKDLNIRLSGDTVLPVWPRRIHFMIFLKKLPPAQMFPIQFHFGNTRLLLKPLFPLPAPLQEIGWCSGCPLHPCSMRRPSASCSNLPPRLDPCRHRSISSPGHGLALF